MPQGDLETLFSACANISCDKKIACETLANAITANRNGNGNQIQPHDDDHQPEMTSDFPPESFWLSKDAEFDWFDRNAVVYERKESHKGNSNSTNLNPNLNPSTASQRFSSTLKTKASIIGLPKPQQKFDHKSKRNCKTATNWFPRRIGSVGNSDAPLCEPSSPKVSCIGRVRSKRDRRRLNKRQGSGPESGCLRSKPERKQKPSLFSTFMMIFRSRKGSDRRKESFDRKSEIVNTHDIRDRLPRHEQLAQRRIADSPPRKSVASEPRRSVDSEPVGLDGLKRFASGRRSDSWVGDVTSQPRRSLDSEPVGLGGMNRFTSGRRSDPWLDEVA